MLWKNIWLPTLSSGLLLSLTCKAQEPIPTISHLPPIIQDINEPEDTWVLWPERILQPNILINTELQQLLSEQKYDGAIENISSLLEEKTGADDQNFLISLKLWCQAHKSPVKIDLKEIKFLSSSSLPKDYQSWIKGRAELANGSTEDGIASLSAVPSESLKYGSAQRTLAKYYADNNQPEQEIEILTNLRNADLAPKDDIKVLRRLTALYPPGIDLYKVLRELWSKYPATASGKSASTRLSSFRPKPEYKATGAEKVTRANALMTDWKFKDVVSEHRSWYSSLPKDSKENCQLWYAFGRSLFKTNQITEASSILSDVGKSCTEFTPDEGAKAFYISGKSLERKKSWASAARQFESIPELYPEHTMGDDGYALAGVAYQISGNIELATQAWTTQVSQYPEGDMLSEGYWRLAWNSYLEGNTAQAIQWSTTAKETFDKTTPNGFSYDPVHRLAQHYWGARWLLYPDVKAPSELTTDDESKETGINALLQLCTDHPTEFYALLAAQRLYELAPERLAAISVPNWISPSSAWQIPQNIDDHEQIQRSLSFIQMGLYQEALEELRRLPKDLKSPSLAAVETIMEANLHPIIAHDRLHKYLKQYTFSEIEDNRGVILHTAFPNTYWEETQVATDGFRYESRIFHALVREESSFNKNIVSWAGAKGLSQLMPATAKQVAGWLKISVNSSTVFDPLTNLTIGARYLEYLHKFFDDNRFMAVGAYNAGEGNMQKWVRGEENPPTDHLIEAIPIRETRGYVKRVLGTYQSYRSQHSPKALYPDWSNFNHKALP